VQFCETKNITEAITRAKAVSKKIKKANKDKVSNDVGDKEELAPKKGKEPEKNLNEFELNVRRVVF
jgi:peptidoglycan hydrolase CwlO-like protein